MDYCKEIRTINSKTKIFGIKNLSKQKPDRLSGIFTEESFLRTLKIDSFNTVSFRKKLAAPFQRETKRTHSRFVVNTQKIVTRRQSPLFASFRFGKNAFPAVYQSAPPSVRGGIGKNPEIRFLIGKLFFSSAAISRLHVSEHVFSAEAPDPEVYARVHRLLPQEAGLCPFRR